MTAADAIAALTRWQEFGGTWRLLDVTGTRATFSLRRCDGGEEQERITGDDPDLLAWLDGRTCDTDQAGTPDRPRR